MTSHENRTVADAAGDAELPDEAIIVRVQAGETDLFRHLLRRYNQRVCRAARAVLFSFMGARCDRMVESVMTRISSLPAFR